MKTPALDIQPQSSTTSSAPITVRSPQTTSTFSDATLLITQLPTMRASMKRPKAPNESTTDAVVLSIQPSAVA